MSDMLARVLECRMDVSRETFERLKDFADLVSKWTKQINLIGARTASDIWDRHIIDSAQIYPLAPKNFSHWADFGSGAGFPGIVIAILSAQNNPDATVSLVESDHRKAVFLRTAARVLELRVQVLAERVENLSPLNADVISARALGTLVMLIKLSHPHLTPGGVAIFPKGRRALEEIAAAEVTWLFDHDATPSMTDPDARILRIERIQRA